MPHYEETGNRDGATEDQEDQLIGAGNVGIAPGLIQFAQDFKGQDGEIHRATAETVAEAFRRYYHLPVPLYAPDITELLKCVDQRRVFCKPGIEHLYARLGTWCGYEEYQRMLVESRRPIESRCKTVLHELIEPLWEQEMRMHSQPYTKSDRERWANRFAAMVKMPPEMFRPRAEELGCDLRALADEFADTLAGVSRQIRDVNLAGRFFYFCRFDLVNIPTNAGDKFRDSLNECGGICVRIVDLARSFTVKSEKRGLESVPMFNLPGKFQYRILNGEMRKYLTERTPIFISGYDAGSSYNEPYKDLFGMNRIAVLIHRYGTAEKSGFFLIAVSEDDTALNPQLDRIRAIRRRDIHWLFRYETFIKRKPPVTPDPQKGLPMRFSRGVEKDMSQEEFQWTI